MIDCHEKQRKEMLKEWADYLDSHEDRLAQAKEQLGNRYLLHPSNQVKRRTNPMERYDEV